MKNVYTDKIWSARLAEQQNPPAMSVARTRLLRGSGNVKRMHTMNTLRNWSVGQHTYNAMCVAVELCHANRLHPGHCLMNLLVHDAPEVWTGDVPAPIKRLGNIKERFDALEEMFYEGNNFRLPSLMAIEEAICKSADYIELCMTCIEERTLGNRSKDILDCFYRALEYIGANTWVHGVSEFITELNEEMTNV